MIYQKLTTGMGQCLLLIRKHADRDGFELWRRKERCWCYFNNVGAEYFKEFFDMRGELTDISEAEALELKKKVCKRKKTGISPGCQFSILFSIF